MCLLTSSAEEIVDVCFGNISSSLKCFYVSFDSALSSHQGSTPSLAVYVANIHFKLICLPYFIAVKYVFRHSPPCLLQSLVVNLRKANLHK